MLCTGMAQRGLQRLTHDITHGVCCRALKGVDIMSGGSHDYMYYRVEEEYVGRMHDIELDDMMKDIVELLHDLEWYDSADYGENDYLETVAKFKAKWFNGNRTERLRSYVDREIAITRDKLMKLIDGKAGY